MEEILEWLNQSEYDLDTAQDMIDSGRYIYAAFMCHLAVEKALKALVVKQTGNAPPKVHNLVYLMELAGAVLEDDDLRFLGRLGSAGVATRYPEDLGRALKQYPPAVAREYLEKARNLVRCLKQQAG
jgi:HEPN domain-containing protein